jgi:heat shock protein HtpX
MKRWLLFFAVNIGILLTLSISFSILVSLGIIPQSFASSHGGLLVFAAVFGFGGAFASLFLSKWMVKRTYNLHEVNASDTDSFVKWYYETTVRLSQNAGIPTPEIYIYEDSSPNAFATGPSRKNSLIAISSGLSHLMSKDEVEGVIGHEIAHIANGDMVTTTLLQGIVNTFVIFFARIIGSFIDKVVFKNQNGHGIGYFVVVIVVEMILSVLGSIIVFWFSRYREFKADEGSVQIIGENNDGRRKMISALQALKKLQERTEPLDDKMTTYAISGGNAKSLMDLFSTHPKLEDRINSLMK